MKLVKDQGISLYYKDFLVFSHTSDKPFVTADIWESKVKRFLGKFEEKGEIIEKIALTESNVISETDKQTVIVFKEGSISLTITFEEKENYLKLFFESKSDCGFSFIFPAYPDEGIFGGGEQYRQLNLKGERVVNLVSEHIKVKPIAQKILLKKLYKPKKHSEISSYSPMCTYVSSKLYALRFNVSSYGVCDFYNSYKSVFSFQNCPKEGTFIKEDSFEEIGVALAKDIPNRQYLPSWCYEGMILGVQGGREIVTEKALKMVEAGASICGVWCQEWSGQYVTAAGKQVYWNWEVDKERYPDLKNTISFLKEKGIHFLAYINPYLIVDGPMYNECKDKGYLVKRKDGSIYLIKSTTFDAGMMDLTNPGMVSYLKNTIIKNNMLDLGIEGYMADFGEYLPLDSVLFSGDPKLLHNEWPVIWARINREAIEEAGLSDSVFFFTRSGYDGAQSYSPIMWNGDQHTDFSIDYGMPCVMPASFNLGFSGLCAIHSDVGGFISFGPLKRDAELFIRWMEMNTFSPLMRSHETIRPDVNCQYDDKFVLPHTVNLTTIHAKLAPYIKHVMEEAKRGIPTIKPDFYLNNDFSSHQDEYSYFFGNDIFVSPIIQKGQLNKEVYLPDGDWLHFFSKKQYSKGKNNIECPLGCPPVFYRADSAFAPLFASIKI